MSDHDEKHYYPYGAYGNPPMPPNPYYPYPAPPAAQGLKSWADYRNPSWVKGAVVGAAAAFVLSNPAVKKNLVKGVVGLWGTLRGGVEELKEQIRDVQAEKGGESD